MSGGLDDIGGADEIGGADDCGGADENGGADRVDNSGDYAVQTVGEIWRVVTSSRQA